MKKIIKNSSKLVDLLNKWHNWVPETNDSELIKYYTKALSHNSRNVKQITKKSKHLRTFLKMQKMLRFSCYIVWAALIF